MTITARSCGIRGCFVIMRILDLIFPPKCAGCGDLLKYDVVDSAFCDICKTKWEQEKSITSDKAAGVAVRRLEEYLGASDEWYAMYLVSYKVGERADIVDRAIMKLKDTANRRIVELFASELAALILTGAPMVCEGGSLHENAVITWIPRSRKARGSAGFDHMEYVARTLSQKLDIPAEKLLARSFFGKEQKHLGALERLLNAKRSIKLAPDASPASKTVILIDDIVTTGASVAAASDVLCEAGAGQVICAVIAASEREEKVHRKLSDNFNIIKKRKK